MPCRQSDPLTCEIMCRTSIQRAGISGPRGLEKVEGLQSQSGVIDLVKVRKDSYVIHHTEEGVRRPVGAFSLQVFCVVLLDVPD